MNDFLHRPWVVLWTCLALAFVNIVLDGTFLRLWSLNRDAVSISASSDELKNELAGLDEKILQAKDPGYMEREARDRFDLVSEGDLVFVFAGEE